MSELIAAPEWQIEEWLGEDAPSSLHAETTPAFPVYTPSMSISALRGKVVLVCAFQMLCPACVSHGLPQAKKAYEAFRREDLTVLGLHTVFEHHEAMQRVSLQAFLHENRIKFPVAIDQADPNHDVPLTMQAYQMRGTPTTILIDKKGCLRKQLFGHEDDMILGAEIATLIAE